MDCLSTLCFFILIPLIPLPPFLVCKVTQLILRWSIRTLRILKMMCPGGFTIAL